MLTNFCIYMWTSHMVGPLARNFKMPSPWRILPRAICAPFSGCRVCKLLRRSAERAENKELAVRPSAIPGSEREVFSHALFWSPLRSLVRPLHPKHVHGCRLTPRRRRGHFKFATLRIQSSPVSEPSTSLYETKPGLSILTDPNL